MSDRLAACVEDPRDPALITHSLADIIRFRLIMIAASYEDGNDASLLRSDPMFKMALDHAPSDRDLCSQSTISRLQNRPNPRVLLRMGRAMVDLYCASFKGLPKRIVLDVDDTFDAVHMMYYNFVHIHQKLRMTPTLVVGVSEKLWKIGDSVALFEVADVPAKIRAPNKKRAVPI